MGSDFLKKIQHPSLNREFSVYHGNEYNANEHVDLAVYLTPKLLFNKCKTLTKRHEDQALFNIHVIPWLHVV